MPVFFFTVLICVHFFENRLGFISQLANVRDLINSAHEIQRFAFIDFLKEQRGENTNSKGRGKTNDEDASHVHCMGDDLVSVTCFFAYLVTVLVDFLDIFLQEEKEFLLQFSVLII